MKNFFLFVLLSGLINAQTIQLSEVDKQILSYTYNEDFSQAKKIAGEEIKNNSSSPKYYYYLINTMIMEYYQKVALLDPEKRDEGRKTLNKEIISYCESVTEKFEEIKLNTENKFYFGTIYGFLARVYGVDGSWWSAFRSGKKAKAFMEDVLKASPQFYDAYLVLGMLDYYSDRMSGITSFIAGALGFSGNRERGLQFLKTAFNKGTLTFGQSALTLMEVYANLEDNSYAAIPYFEAFLKTYSQNKRTFNSYCQLLLNIWDINAVARLMKNDKMNLMENIIKARYYDMIGNSEMAVRYATLTLQQSSLLRGSENSARYILAFNYWLTGDNTNAFKFERQLNERAQETFALVKKYPNENKWLRILQTRAINNIKNEEMDSFLQSKPNFKYAPQIENEVNLILGQYFFNNNQYEKAESYFNLVSASEQEREKYVALRFLIEIYNRQNVSAAKVKKLLSLIDDADNDRLKFRANDLEKKYKL